MPQTEITGAVRTFLGLDGNARRLQALAGLVLRTHPEAQGLVLRVTARCIENLSSDVPDRPGRANPHLDTWLSVFRHALPEAAGEWRKRMQRQRAAVRGERRLTIAAAIRRRHSAKALDEIGRRSR